MVASQFRFDGDAATVGLGTNREEVRDALIKRRRPDLPRVQRPFTGVMKGTGVLSLSGGSGPRSAAADGLCERNRISQVKDWTRSFTSRRPRGGGTVWVTGVSQRVGILGAT